VLVQDADLEYNPQEYPNLLQPILDGRADVVYGSRFLGGDPHRVLYFWHYVGNKLLTLLSNMFTNLNFTDMETCYKVFRRSVLEQIQIEENRFGFEPEITAKVARLGCPIYEIGISYSGRTYSEGKKVNWRDGVSAIWYIVKYNLLRWLTFLIVEGKSLFFKASRNYLVLGRKLDNYMIFNGIHLFSRNEDFGSHPVECCSSENREK